MEKEDKETRNRENNVVKEWKEEDKETWNRENQVVKNRKRGQGNMEQRKSSSQGAEKEDKDTRNRENQVVKEWKKRTRKQGTEKIK